MFIGLKTAIYPVPDLVAAKKWYATAFGVKPHFEEAFYVGFPIGGYELGLIPDGTPSTSGPQPLWETSSIEEAFAHLVGLGAVALEPVTQVGGGVKVAAVVDPFGNRLGLVQTASERLNVVP